MKTFLRTALSMFACLALIISGAVAVIGLTAVGATSASATQTSDPGPANQLPSAVPSAITPSVDNGETDSIAQVGNTMVIGGTFTSVGGQTRDYVAAFNATTGAAVDDLQPDARRVVNTVIPGPTPTTAYVGGNFTTVSGVAASSSRWST